MPYRGTMTPERAAQLGIPSGVMVIHFPTDREIARRKAKQAENERPAKPEDPQKKED